MSMTGVTKQIEAISERVLGLSLTHRIIFSVAVCEYLMPWVEAWRIINKLKINNEVQVVVNSIWLSLSEEQEIMGQKYQTGSTDLQAFLEVIRNSSHSIYRELALRATKAVALVLDDGLIKPSERVGTIPSLIINAFQIYLTYVTRPSYEYLRPGEEKFFVDWIFQAPLMTVTLQEMKHTLKELENRQVVDRDYLEHLRRRSQGFGINPMEITLVVGLPLS